MEQSKIVQHWLQSATENLSVGEELLLPAKNKKDATEKLKLFSDKLRQIAKTNSLEVSELSLTTRFKDHRFWLIIKKIAYSPLIGFKKGKTGEVERVLIADSSSKRRRLLLMKEDGFSIAEIQEVEGTLNQEELMLLA